MAIGWMTILSNVPWSDVIKNAPAVADGAKKLWKKVGSKASGGLAPSVNIPEGSPDAHLAALQIRVEELHAQMLTASEVIRSLAEQNEQLVARIESNRRRMLLLTIVNLIIAGFVFAVYFTV